MMILGRKVALAVIAFVGISVLAWCETTASRTHSIAANKSQEGNAQVSKKPVATSPALSIYYFHGHVRCVNCINFEHFTDELLKKDFSEDLANGRIEWKVINVDIPGNAHYVDEYKLFTKSLILVPHKGKNNSFKNLTDIWKYAGDKAKFQSYVKAEIQKALSQEKQ